MRTRRIALALALLGASLATLLTAPTPDVAQAAPGALTWSDEFNGAAGTGPDGNKWKFDIGGGGWGNNEQQYYTSSTRNAAHDGNGNMVITARRENPANYQCHYGTCQYTSARLLTADRFSQTYGRYEARIKIPRTQGIWPAFWMLGGSQWPDNGEIDILENIGREPSTVWGTLHGPGYSGGNAISSSYTLPNGQAFADAFHTFTVDWAPDSVTWYVDGNQYARKTPADLRGNRWVYDHPFFMIMNVAVGGYWPGYPDGSTQFPQQMLIDYVRVWAWNTGGGNPGTGGPLIGYGNKCVDIPGATPTEGIALQLWDCNGTDAQRWSFPGDGTVRAMGKCMDVAWGSTANGANIQLATCSGNAAQQFVLTGAGDLVNPQANKCVDVRDWSTANGAKLQTWTCGGGANQKWRRG
ncbi:beta-glucanase (GH16 family) [Micromonospora pisi]|uniref:Beta-glucanase (GH16 family) n=1 Tax=Micromonospora pisi TaxID=589240 RepID=A0A495JMU6_9ACTN|nr:family 16 glycosylhydrolase [Micromonospora pisi]RKR89662.1 beta-glucanase (GH16 family) [Micromonospora pisi]